MPKICLRACHHQWMNSLRMDIDALEGAHLNGVTKRRPRAVGLEAIHLSWLVLRLSETSSDALLLRRPVWRRDAGTASVLVGLAAWHGSKDLPAELLEFEENARYALPSEVAICGDIVCKAAAPEGEHTTAAAAHETERAVRKLRTAANRTIQRVEILVLQVQFPGMSCHQTSRACGVDRLAGSLQIQGEIHPVGNDGLGTSASGCVRLVRHAAPF
mmetsp:Transcript_57482/g.134629  ORF Transcript_57482/g.134629 Transcript_57482/m.134629 type:complete len:216 (-) Transcript_57482:1320-1967(-)